MNRDPKNTAGKTKVFISYSRRDLAFTDRLATALEGEGLDVLIDRQDIVKGEAWKERIFALIDQADTVVFLISTASVSSPICQEEVAYAESLNKRLLPLLVQDPLDEHGKRIAVPAALARINYIDYTKGADDSVAFVGLMQALLVDLDWVREHTRLGGMALKWQHDGEPTSQLLRGRDLDNAEAWRDRHPKDSRPPTELQLRFISESRKGAGRRRNMLVGSLVAGLVIALGLGAYAWWQKDRAQTALLHGARTANNLVSSLAQRFRGEKGIPQSLVADILQRSESLARNLMQLDDGSEELQLGRGAALAELSDTYLTLGRDEEAYGTAKEAVSWFRRLVEGHPSDQGYRINLASSYVRLGDVNRAMSEPAAALRNYEEARDVLAGLPAKGRAADVLAVVNERIGSAKLADDDYESAQANFERCLALRKTLTESDLNFLALSTCHGKIGAVAMRQGDWPAAVAAYRKALEVAEKVAPAELAHRVDWQREIVTIHHQLGDALWKSGEPDRGLAEFEEDLAMTRAIQLSDPERADWQEDLVRSYERIGNVSLELQKFPEALSAFQSSLALAKTLNLEKSKRAVWQSDLFKMYQNAGLLLMQMKDYDGALGMGQESVAYFTAQPNETDADLGHLVESHQNLAWYALMARKFGTALAQSEAAIALAPDLLQLKINQAHALMFLNRRPEARALYLGNRGREVPDPSGEGKITWEHLVLADFATFRDHGMQHEMMEDVQGTFEQ